MMLNEANSQNTIGKFLKEQREEMGLTLEDISRHTKINFKLLKSLENNKLKDLPNKAFVKGYVQNYAKCLNLDVSYAQDLLEITYTSMNPEPPKVKVEKEAANNEELTSLIYKNLIKHYMKDLPVKKIMLGLVILLVVGVSFNILNNILTQVTKDQVSPTLKKTPQDQNQKSAANNLESKNEVIANKVLTKESETQVERKELKEVTNKETTPESTNDTIKVKKKEENLFDLESTKKLRAEVIKNKEVKEETKKEEPVLSDGELPFMNFSGVSGPLFEVETNATSETLANLPEHIKASMVPGKSNVFINAIKDDSWISYQVDNGEIKRYILRKGRTLLLRGDIILMFLGNVNATKIFYNNEPILTNSKTGVKSLIFPPEISTEYELPLFPSFKGILYPQATYKQKMQKQ